MSKDSAEEDFIKSNEDKGQGSIDPLIPGCCSSSSAHLESQIDFQDMKVHRRMVILEMHYLEGL